jgi:2-isopropylmalate synthase
VHAAAIVKALRNHDRKLADAVYSGVPAHLVGLQQVVEIGPMSGKSNVIHWLATHGMAETDEVVNRIFEAAKQSHRVLTDDEVRALCVAPGAPA